MKEHQMRMFSIKIIKFENKKKASNDKEFQVSKQRQKTKKKIETIKKSKEKIFAKEKNDEIVSNEIFSK